MRLRAPLPRMASTTPAPVRWGLALFFFFCCCCFSHLSHVDAASVPFSDCTPRGDTSSGDPRLQWVTRFVDAVYNPHSPHNLSITVYGDVTGYLEGQPKPPPRDDLGYWDNPNNTVGKIVDVLPGTGLATTFFAQWSVANNDIVSPPHTDFCDTTTGCPISPAFPANASLDRLPKFNITQNMPDSYSFSTINAHFYAEAGDQAATKIVCVDIDVTPYIGSAPANLVRYLPVLVLVMVAVATASAVFSPWGTWNIYHWTSNYGRDADQLRLITPGFGDCLGYIQFVVLSGSLRLIYPGFFQPIISQVGWSTLMFNQSFVSHVPGINPIQDGLYSLGRNATTETSNLSTTRQIIGMGTDNDIWAGFMVWLLVIIGVLVLLIQLGTLCRILYFFATRTRAEDLRHKNWPFTAGNVIRVVFNYFFLPLVTFCIYQMFLAARLDDDDNPAYLVALASLTLLILLAFAGWLLYQIQSTNPKSFLFDDLPTVLLYGPLYNTYSDSAANFALVPFFVNIIRGIAIGGLQMSGIAQIIVLAICEILVILTLNAFRPFSSPTSMNLYHTAFSVVRIVVLILSVAFVPSLNAPPGARSIVGYVILFLHAVVLFVGFFLHSIQTLLEVAARALGAGGEGADAQRGGLVKVFGVRQLSRRNRVSGRARGSMGSTAAMLTDVEHDGKISRQEGMRSRSVSASSGFLLNAHAAGTGSDRQSLALDTLSQPGRADGTTSRTPNTASGAPSMLSYTPAQSQAGFERRTAGAAAVAGTGLAAARLNDGSDPYYRQPRQRRPTNEALVSPGTRSQSSWHSTEWAKRSSAQGSEDLDSPGEAGLREGATPSPAHIGYDRSRPDLLADDPSSPKPDYATREVDYYYGVRGPALNDQSTRKLKTGPADPTGPVSSATGWFKTIFGAKSKDKHKGFEVVRGRGVPKGMEPVPLEEPEQSAQEEYHDEPIGVAVTTTAPRKMNLEDEADAIGAGTRRIPGEDERAETGGLGITQGAPILPEIDTGSSINIPSRIGSKASRAQGNSVRYGEENRPDLPRTTSTRSAALSPGIPPETPPGGRFLLPTIEQSPAADAENNQRSQNYIGTSSSLNADRGVARLPFGSLTSGSERAAPNIVGSSLGPRHERGTSMISEVSAPDSMTRVSDLQAPPSPIDPDSRRGSIGYVSQHRASDSIVTPTRVMGGSTAELIDDGPLGEGQNSHNTGNSSRGAPHINF